MVGIFSATRQIVVSVTPLIPMLALIVVNSELKHLVNFFKTSMTKILSSELTYMC